MTTILTVATSAGDVELYETREGYYITNPEGYRIGNLGCGAFKDLDHAVNVTSQVAATWEQVADARG